MNNAQNGKLFQWTPEQRAEMAKRIRPARLLAGLTQDELAGRVGLSRRSIIAIEAGASVPTGETLSRVLVALDIMDPERGYRPEVQQLVGVIAPLLDRLSDSALADLAPELILLIARHVQRVSG